MARQYSNLQLLRTIIENRLGVEGRDTTEARVVLRLLTKLYNVPSSGSVSYEELFDLIADVYSDGVVWDFSEEDNR